MILEALSLSAVKGFLSEILKAVLSDKAKEWMKPVSPEIKGKHAAFELYQRMEKLDFQMQQFVEALRSVLDAASVTDGSENDWRRFDVALLTAGSEKEWRYFGACRELAESLRSVLAELQAIDGLIRQFLRPALSIHRPEIILAITKMTADRSQALPIYQDPISDTMKTDEYKREFANLVAESVPKLRERLAIAQENQRLISATIGEFRQLLAKEFSFKDSFV